MKDQFIKDLKAGDAVNEVFAITEKQMASKRDGEPFLNLKLGDKTGALKAVVWDNVQTIHAAAGSGDVVRVRGNVTEYRGSLQVVIREILKLENSEVSPEDFLPATTQSIETMFDRLVNLTNAFEDEHLRGLFEAFWRDADFRERFIKAPAAKKMHHAYIGGLLEHCLSMALLADKVARHYNGIDRELLVAGAIVHDIGKIREFDYRHSIEYSDEGRLLSHIYIGMQMVEDKIRGLPDFPEEKALLLKHMIVSHHGTREFGSPEPPKTIEAFLLHYIDEIDAKVNGIREFMASEDSVEAWTSYHRVLERFIYKGRPEDRNTAGNDSEKG